MIHYEEDGVKGLRNETKEQLQCLMYTVKRRFTLLVGSSFFGCLNRFYFLFLSTQN